VQALGFVDVGAHAQGPSEDASQDDLILDEQHA